MKSLGGAQGVRHEATEAQHAKTRYLKYYTQHWQRLKNQVVLSLVHVTAEMNAKMIAGLEAITGNANTQESGVVTVTTGGENSLENDGTLAQTAAMTGKRGVKTDVTIAVIHHLQETPLARTGKTDQESSPEDATTDQEKDPRNAQNGHLQGVESVTDAAETDTCQENAKRTLTSTAAPSTQARDHLLVVTSIDQEPEPRDSAALQSGSQILQTTRQPTLRLLHRLMTSFSHFLSQHLPWRQVRFQS